jgi:beta-N-acetylhexosaminidase
MILVCNDPTGVAALLSEFTWPANPPIANALSLKPETLNVVNALEQDARWLAAIATAKQIHAAV